MDDLHRVHITPDHFHMARMFMVRNRLRSTRIAVQKMIEIVTEHEEVMTEKGARTEKGVEIARK